MFLTDKKLLLWVLLLIQLCFIFGFWMLQTTYHTDAIGENNKKLNNEFKGVPAYTNNRVKFIKNGKSHTKMMGNGNAWENVNNFKRDYLKVNINRLINITGIEAEIFDTEYVCCFREGMAANDTSGSLLSWNFDDSMQSAQCRCQRYWHGKDCGQPEVIWRALMLPGKQFKIRKINENLPPHRLIYMLEGYFHSLDILELQIKSLENVVDQFLIYLISSNANRMAAALKPLQRRLNAILKPTRYILYYCTKNNRNSCSTAETFKYFKKQLKVKLDNQLLESDLFLYSNENIIYAREPLKFLKYYSTTEMPVWRFRLKHNVYGFYWQHPERTHLSGFICSFGYLESKEKLQNLITSLDSESSQYYSSHVIGDLNHYGGWFCQYCQHPDEILKELPALPNESSSYMKGGEQLPTEDGRRNHFIDAKYLEYLIAQGIDIDGKTQLMKIRQYNDKYFAPTYAEMCKWKFGNLLTNLYEAMESDYVIEEAEGGAGF